MIYCVTLATDVFAYPTKSSRCENRYRTERRNYGGGVKMDACDESLYFLFCYVRCVVCVALSESLLFDATL